MVWRKIFREAKAEVADVSSLININDRVQLVIRGVSYLSRVEDIHEGELSIGCPIKKGKVIEIKPGSKVMLNLFLDDGLMQYQAVAVRIEPNRIPLLVVSNLVSKGQVQRRAYVRVQDKLQIRYRIEGTIGNASSWLSGVTRDISGGGLNIVIDADSGVVVNDSLEIEIQIPNDKVVRAFGNVVRIASVVGKTMGIGVNYVQIHPVEQRRIVQYVSRRQIEQANVLKQEIENEHHSTA